MTKINLKIKSRGDQAIATIRLHIIIMLYTYNIHYNKKYSLKKKIMVNFELTIKKNVLIRIYKYFLKLFSIK